MDKRRPGSGFLFGAAYLLFVAVSASGPGNQLWSWSPVGGLPAILVSLPGIAGAILRHRWPRAAYGLTVVSMVGSFVVGVVVPLMLFLFDACYFAAVRWGMRHRNLVLWVAAAATLCAFTFAYSASGLPFAATMAFIFLIAAWLPIFWGLDVQAAHQIAEAERARSRSEREAAVAAVQNASDRAELLIAEERVKLASELHDTVSSRLAAISLQSQTAMTDLEEERRRDIVGQIRSEAIEALEEMKKEISLLKGAESHAGAAPGVERLGDLVARSESLGQNAKLDGPSLEGLSLATSRLVYKVVHEGLLNAAKHAPSADVRVTWKLRPEGLIIRIVNEMPVSPSVSGSESTTTLLPGTRLGLASLRERVCAAHGSFAAGVEDGQWCINAEIPNLPMDAPAFSTPHIRSEL